MRQRTPASGRGAVIGGVAGPYQGFENTISKPNMIATKGR